MKSVQFGESKKGWSRDSRCLWSIFGRDEWTGRRETRKGTWVYSWLALESTQKDEQASFKFVFWLIWLSCTNCPKRAQTKVTWRACMKRDRGNEGWEATRMKSWIHLPWNHLQARKKEKMYTGERNDFFGNYLILNQSGMEKKSRNPKIFSDETAEDLEQPQPFIRSNRRLRLQIW